MHDQMQADAHGRKAGQCREHAGRIEVRRGNLEDPAFADAALAGADVVFHLASRAYGVVWNLLITKLDRRVVFVIGKDGRIRHVIRPFRELVQDSYYELQQAVQAAAHRLDLYVTGEPSESVTYLCRELGLNFAALGHYATERVGVLFRRRDGNLGLIEPEA